MVSVGEVYTFKHLWIGESDSEESGRILNTTLHIIQTVKTQVENLSEEQRCTFNDIALLEADGENTSSRHHGGHFKALSKIFYLSVSTCYYRQSYPEECG